METLVNLVVQRTGLSEDKARAAVDTVIGFLKERAPAGLSGQLDAMISGEGGSSGSGLASGVAGMMRGKQ